MLSEKERAVNLRAARQLHEGAYRKFWDRIEAAPGDRISFFDYGLAKDLVNAPWRSTAGEMAGRELGETTNLIHRWMLDLDRLGEWLSVLSEYPDDQDSYAIRFEFVEPLMHRCLQAPSHLKDVLISVATNAVHQANLSLVADYKDELPSDGTLLKGRFLTRSQALSRLKYVSRPWDGFDEFVQLVESLDGVAYRQKTRDYRNRSSHAIPPNFEFGQVQFWTRTVGYRHEKVRNHNGSFSFKEDRSRIAVAYGFGGVNPLNLDEALRICRSQYEIAVRAFSTYREFLNQILLALHGSCGAERHFTATPQENVEDSERKVGNLLPTDPQRSQ